MQTGHSDDLVAIGRNLGEGAVESACREAELAYEERAFPFTAPAELALAGDFRFSVHPTDHSVLPTAATCTLTGVQFQPTPDGLADAQTLLVTDSPVTLEAEPNDAQEQPQPVALPLVISGRFDRPRDADSYEFEIPESGQYGFDVYCERINGHADPYLVVVDDQGNRVNELDDFGHRINAFDGHLRDPVGMVNLNAKLMPQAQRFPYVEIDPSLGAASALPYVPLTLELNERIVSVSGLVDSGAALSVLPHDVGIQLGAVWEQQNVPVQLAGNLADSDARAILVTATIGRFAPVRLAFAWTNLTTERTLRITWRQNK